MSESPEVANDPPAIKRLRTVRKTLTRDREQTCKEVEAARRRLDFYEGRLREIDRERNDIDRAITALSYPEGE